MLSLAASFVTSVIPPTTLTCWFSFLLITAPVSPPYFIPSSNVATWWGVPELSVYWILSIVVPGVPATPGLPWTVEIVADDPSFPLSPIEPSFPLIDTPSFPLASFTVITPSLPGAPTVTEFVFTVSAVTVSDFRFLSILTTNLPPSSTTFRFCPLYSLSALVPSPTISRVSPNCLFTVAPVFPLKFRPLFIVLLTLVILLSTSFNWDTFTASVSFTPAATFLITLSPALIPSFVTDISLAPGVDELIVNPPALTTVLSPAAFVYSVFPAVILVLSPAALVNSAEFNPVRSLFKLYS